MNKVKYVNIPISRKSRDVLKDLTDILKLKYDQFMGYDEVIEELVRNMKEHDEFVKQQMKLVERNGRQIIYTKEMEKNRFGKI